ncbi:MAG TPA: integrase [Xanthobacteraceae bacterium]|nr:integrase [Xanthobacteraceae bacterium]
MALKLVKRKGSKYIYMRGTVRGAFVFESTGVIDRKSAEPIRALREAELIEQSVFGKRATLTFNEAAAHYLAHHGAPEYVGKLVSHFGSQRKLHTISQSDLDAAADEIYPNASYQTKNRQVHTPFIAIWNKAVAGGWAPEKKWSRPKKPKGTLNKPAPKRSGTRAVGYERAYEFVSAMSPAPGLIMTCLFYTGMRPIELMSLDADVDDVRPDDSWLVLSNSKTGQPRGVPLHDFIVPIFRALKTRGGRLFRTPKNRPYTDGGQIKTAILGARERTGITDVSPYTGRHTVSTQLVVNGVHPHIKDQILGHAVTEMSRVYTHVPVKSLIEAINTLPVPPAWRELEWIKNPLAKSRYFVREKPPEVKTA